jgi:hypothetical protein
VERTSLVPESVLASRELTEVLGRLGDDIIKQLDNDASGGLAADGDIELAFTTQKVRTAIYEKPGLVCSTGCRYVRRR